MPEYTHASVSVNIPVRRRRPGGEYRPGWWRPAPEDDGPIPAIPQRVLWRGSAWEVEEVDVLGRWLLSRLEEDYEERYYEERYAPVEEIEVPEVHDARPWVGCRELGWMDRILRETYLPAIMEQLKRDWHTTLFGSTAS